MLNTTVRHIRENLGLTVDELAFILRVCQIQLMAWEDGRQQIPEVYASMLFRFNQHGLGIFAPAH